MERTCSQTIKIPFPIRVFYGTEVTVNIPRSGDVLKNVRLVVDFPTSLNTLGENIVEKAEIIVDDEMIDTTYGEFIHVENTFNTPVEKYDRLQQLLCTTSTGTMYMDIPFGTTNNEGLYLNESGSTQVRILFSSSGTGEISGYLLVDYYLISNIPKFPYVQRTTQVQRFTRIANSPKQLKMAVYAVGSVYQLYFTVKDVSTGEYVDALTNVTLNFGEKERFNLSGKYLRYVEPLKRLYTYAAEPMYMYSFCTNPSIPSGSTHFNEKSNFLLDFYDNNSTYEVTIWAKNHDFLYSTEKTTKRIFESTEMLIDTVQSFSSNYQEVPLRVSYINYSSSIVIFYSSPYEISNVAVTTNAPSYNVTQNTIEFTGVDSLRTEYTANVIFSSQGFSDATCYFRIIGNSVHSDSVYYSENGNYPTHIDLGQNFHYLLGNVFDFSNTVFTSNIQTFSVDECKNYAFTTYTSGNSNILGSSSLFTGPGCIIAKYDENMNLLYTVTASNSNVTELASSNTYGLYGGSQGTVISRDLGYSYGVSAGSSTVYIDVVTPTHVSARFTSSSTNVTVGSQTTNFGNGTDRVCLATRSSIVAVVSNIRQVKTALEMFSNGQPVWSFMYSSTSSSSSSIVTIPSSSNGYLIWSAGWSKTITNVTSSNFDSKIITDKMTDSVYLIAGYTSTTPSLSGFTFATGTGFFVVKFDRSGNTKYVVSFIGSGIISFSPMVDSTTGRFMISVTSQIANILNVYNNGSSIYNGPGRFQFFIFDDYGNINSNSKDLSELFAVSKPTYFTPLCSSKFFDKYGPDVPSNTIWSCFTSGSSGLSDTGISRITTDSNGDVYTITPILSGFSNIFDKYGDTKVRLLSVTPMTVYISKFTSNCVYTGNISYITNLKTNTGFLSLFNKTSFLYILVTTNAAGIVTVYNKNGTSVFTLNPTSETLLLLKFNTDGTYANWYATVTNSLGCSVNGDSNGNLYFTGVKTVTSAQNIVINGTTVGSVPLTTNSNTSFVVKLTSSDVFSWRAYVDGVNGDSHFSIADSSGNVYITGNKPGGTASIINGDPTKTVPTATSITSAYAVKFDSSGVYASWNAYITNTGSDVTFSANLTITSNNELGWFFGIGGFVIPGRTSTFKLYINGVDSATFQIIQEVCTVFIAFTSVGGYNWLVRSGMQSGNSAFPAFSVTDRLNNFVLTVGRQPYALLIYDKTGTLYTIPASAYASGVMYKINNDGTFTDGNYVYIDSSADDGISTCTIDRNGDMFMSGTAGGTDQKFGYTRYFTYFDKSGYEGVTDVIYNQIRFGYLVKCNANFTFNKISL